ncbi:hypothetical protein TKK_0010096 [Trichogramma kaykai]|uniref:Peptidase M12B domain-containing protein n=1 Tax=Trichogramma kaykai TaxID=54128 RepID=A0ABD2WYH7_9HYME
MNPLLYLPVLYFLSCETASTKFDRQFTDEEALKIFHRHQDNIPNYHKTHLKTHSSNRAKRDVRPVEFEIDGETYRLNLQPIKYDVMSTDIPVWIAETDPNKPTGRTFKRVDPKSIKINGLVYQDAENAATLLAYYKNDYIHYDGIFGESSKSRVVRSILEKWYTREPMDHLIDSHVVYDVESKFKSHEDEELVKSMMHIKENVERLKEPLDVMYPKLLLVIEYELFKLFNEDVQELIRYQTLLWNAINLKYRSVESPKIKLVITGIVIAKDYTVFPYIYNARNETEMNSINHLKLLVGGAEYFKEVFPKELDFKNYDSSITLISSTYDTNGVAGSAFPGQICGDYYNIGFIGDDANFDGLFTAVHEIGHLLNLPHDGTVCKDKYNESIGHIMAPQTHWVEKYVWSKCSIAVLQDFASRKIAECTKFSRRTERP